jgi:hypothetical protein
MITHNPLRGSGRAALPHPARALGKNAHAAQGIGMTDRRQRQPAVDEAPHAIPKDAAVLAAPRQRAMPEPPDLEPKDPQRVLVQGHSVIADVSTHHRLQPLALFGDGFVHAPLKLGFHLVQLRLQSLAYRLPQHRKPSITPLLYADMRKAQEVERLRFPFSTPRPAVARIAHPANRFERNFGGTASRSLIAGRCSDRGASLATGPFGNRGPRKSEITRNFRRIGFFA